MRSKMLLKENATHGTVLMPIAIHHLSYDSGVDNFFYLHWHNEFEFIVVLTGGIIYTIEGIDYCIMQDEGLFIQPNELHSARSYDGRPCEACVILFHPTLFGDNKQGSAYSKFVYPILNGEIEFARQFSCSEKWQKSVIDIIKAIDILNQEDISQNELLLKSRLFELWHLCYKNSTIADITRREKRNYKIERIQPVLDFIHQNYKEELTLSSLSKLLPMSEGRFCHSFKEVVTISPIAYVLRCRILQSCSLLTETDLKIADIARSVGFNNISYFNREFIKAVGCTPKKYRTEGQF